jgi:membrane-bound metal-dependent hydrolase YbcI (DUF457 family)
MANFKTHLTASLVTTLVVSSGLQVFGLLPNSLFLVAILLLIGVVSGLLPDVDSDNSKLLRIFFNLLGVAGAILASSLFCCLKPILLIIAVAVFAFIFVRYFIFKLFKLITVHRGIIHSIPYALFLSLLMVIICFYIFKQSSLFSWACGVMLLSNYLMHLIFDELVSVNLLGAKMKRSLGTALTVLSLKCWPSYLLLYFLLFGLFSIVPDYHEFIGRFNLTQMNIFFKNLG